MNEPDEPLEEYVQAVIAAILLSSPHGSQAMYLLERGGDTVIQNAVVNARRILTVASQKTIVPERPGIAEHGPEREGG